MKERMKGGMKEGMKGGMKEVGSLPQRRQKPEEGGEPGRARVSHGGAARATERAVLRRGGRGGRPVHGDECLGSEREHSMGSLTWFWM